MSLEQFCDMIEVNLIGVFLIGRTVAQHMIRLGNGGVIINISSISRHGNAGHTNYSAAKAPVVAIANTGSRELAPYGIRCGSIAPRFVHTEVRASINPEILERISARVPLGRLGKPAEISHAAPLYIGK